MDKGMSILVGLLSAFFGLMGFVALEKTPGFGVGTLVVAATFLWWATNLWRRMPTSDIRSQQDRRARRMRRLIAAPLWGVATFVLYWMFAPGIFYKKIANDSVTEAIKQYELVKASGNKMDTCTHAGAVAMLMVNAHDSAGYQRWKTQQSRDCGEAGLTLPD